MTPGRPASRPRVPVIALTGCLGAGKTTLLNHLLRTPGARLGVVINDFGDINVDAALVSGEVDEPASVAGGCLCCMPDAGGLESALERLTAARADLDAILVEASGLAEPPNLVRLLRSAASRRSIRSPLWASVMRMPVVREATAAAVASTRRLSQPTGEGPSRKREPSTNARSSSRAARTMAAASAAECWPSASNVTR